MRGNPAKSLRAVTEQGIGVLRANHRLYLAVNAGYYGLVAAGMVFSFWFPQAQRTMLEEIRMSLTAGPLARVTEAYLRGSIPAAAALTFLVNLVLGTLVAITLPSLVFPPLGALAGAYRAALWGVLLSPAEPALRLPLIPHTPTLLLEGQGYILAVFAGLAAWQGFWQPARFGERGRLAGYRTAWRRSLSVYALVVAVLLVAAIYEAVEVILMMRMSPGHPLPM